MRGGISIGMRVGIGGGGGGAAAPLFGALQYVDPAKVLQYVRADAGITLNGADRVSAWADQSPAAVDYAQATAADQPLYAATGGPNSTPCVTVDGANRFLLSSLAIPAPGTTPTTIWWIGRIDTWTNARRIFSSHDSLKQLILMSGSSPAVAQFNGSMANGNSAGTVSSWFRNRAYFSGGTGDLYQIGATTQTGASAGTSGASTARSIGNNTNTNCALYSYAEVLYVTGSLSAGELTALDAYVTSRYGAGLV